MRKILLFVALTFGTLTFAGPAHADTPKTCHLELFEGTATAVDCLEGTIVASYKYADGVAPGAALEATFPQTLFDSGVGHALVPPCAFQIDAITGDVLPVIDADHLYGDRKVAEAVHGGTEACVAPTTTTEAPTTTTQPSTTVPETVPPTVPPVTLPQTGKHSLNHAEIGFGLILMGVGLIVFAAERKRQFGKS